MHRDSGAKSVQNMLTDAFIRGAAPGTYWDTNPKGLGIRVGKQSKTFLVLVGSGRRHSLGRFPLMSLADARQEAKRVLAEKQLGKIHPKHVAFDDAKRDFLADCAKRTRLRTKRDYERLLNRHLPFGRKSLGDIEPRQLVVILNRLSDTPSEKHHAFTAARVFFKWCVRQHLIPHSPLENLETPSKGRARERVLDEDEVAALWEATAPPSTFHAIVRLLLLTGQRRGEIARMEWSWITNDLCTLPGAVTKNRRAHTFPMSPKARAILDTIPRFKDNPYVFPARRQSSEATTVFAGWSKPKAALDRHLSIEPWTLHDLRRTVASGMASLGVPQIVVEKLLNHVSGGAQSPIAQVYNRYSYIDEMRAAVLQWDDKLDTLLAPRA